MLVFGGAIVERDFFKYWVVIHTIFILCVYVFIFIRKPHGLRGGSPFFGRL